MDDEHVQPQAVQSTNEFHELVQVPGDRGSSSRQSIPGPAFVEVPTTEEQIPAVRASPANEASKGFMNVGSYR